MNDPSMECDVCGGTDFHKESGYFYCNECQTQSQQVQEHVFEQGEYSNTAAKKIQKKQDAKQEEQLTSWECYNIVLKGLTDELITLGAVPQLKTVVRLLWMKYLHKCEVFDVNSNLMPKISVLGPKKDIAILYNRKKRKRSRSRASSATGSLSARRVSSGKKRALVKSQYEQLSQSQSLTQDSLLMNSLSSLKSASETSGSEKIQYNKLSTRELNGVMSKRHRKEHELDLDCVLTCHKLGSQNFSSRFRTGPTVLTSHTLYSILYIGLLIVGDSIQLGDLLRYIREGHVSFECFRHFFNESIPDKAINLPYRNQKLLSNSLFRKRTAKLVRFLGVSSYICIPDLTMLCSRYCAELNLPEEIFQCTEKLISRTTPKMSFTQRPKEIPNYEGRAMSIILFTLKLFFGLDGGTEKHLSRYAEILNNTKVGLKMFNFCKWVQFIAYRNVVMKKFHMSTALREDAKCDSDTYLNYLKNQGVKYSGRSRKIHTEVQDYLQVLEKVLEDNVEDDDDSGEVKFKPSSTPFLSYTTQLLNSDLARHGLEENFSLDSLEFLLRPSKYLKLLETRKIRNRGANEDINIQDQMYLYYANIYPVRKRKKTVPVRIVDDIDEDKCVKEYLESRKKAVLKTTDLKVLLSNWRKGHKKQFVLNKIALEVASEHVQIPPTASADQKYIEHFNPFERYWLNVPLNPVVYYLNKQDMNQIFATFPHSLQLILKEGCRITEQDTNDLFREFLSTELYMGYCSNLSSSGKAKKSKVVIELRDSIRSSQLHW